VREAQKQEKITILFFSAAAPREKRKKVSGGKRGTTTFFKNRGEKGKGEYASNREAKKRSKREEEALSQG